MPSYVFFATLQVQHQRAAGVSWNNCRIRNCGPWQPSFQARWHRAMQIQRLGNTYLGAFQRWKTWAVSHGFTPLPANSSQAALYLQHLGDTTKSKASVEEAFNALAWVHSSSSLPSPTLCPFLRTTLEGLQRILARPVTKKTPVSVELLARIVEDASRSGSLSDLRLATACLLSFAGFLRFNELIHIKPCDIKV